ncbi:MAG: NapH/MauN family ferredoxin-type protein [Betaproteobacteria bacterium]|nr:NapH/MauN family ferredoxin-type protein [Betaproteobacteria bacterium]MCC6246486.1 NapH/MauN family ferredoxin-type protein [Rubrivivax sp.]
MSSVPRERFVEQVGLMFGREPKRPSVVTEQAIRVHEIKRARPKAEVRAAIETAHAKPQKHKWRNRRWAVLIACNLLFTISFALDIQVLEGALTASRFIGFHLIDLNSAVQVMLAHKHIITNLVIGTLTVATLWLLLGGRTFCSWVCPYHLLSEWAEKLHLWLASKKLVNDQQMNRGLRVVFWLVFAAAAVGTGYTVFEAISPTGIVSRALIYGPGLALLWVAALLLFEVVISRRAWCRYACPIGLTYGVVGIFSPVRVKYNLNDCLHEGDCRKVCLVPHVLETVIKGRAADVDVPLGPDCTRCGLCVDTCPTGSLTFDVKGLSKLL